ncbi:MAG: hypothetical protein CBC35_10925 [Planctomycetes bacterium TMED75]|nr:hypothetical protein [Planctomycetaceae bacterium]OUU90765.1 MAG: hypothetical protein CBC35_10925 [Planctomycetes bacterium TMED75]
MTTKRAKRHFWTNKRIKAASSLPCRDLLLALEDGNEHTAKELSNKTGRTPGALHAPLQLLCKEGIIQRKILMRQESKRGRPAQAFLLNPKAAEEPMELTSGASLLRVEGDGAALRMLNRRAKSNLTGRRKKSTPPVNKTSIEYSFLNEREVAQVERKIAEIQSLLRRKRAEGPTEATHRIRVGLIMVEERD